MGLLWGSSQQSLASANRDIAIQSIEKIIDRLKTATQIEEKRAAIKGLRGFSRSYPQEVGSLAIRPLLDTVTGSIQQELKVNSKEFTEDTETEMQLFFSVDDTESLLSIIELLLYLCSTPESSGSRSSCMPFAEIIMKLENDVHSFLSLLSLNEDFELRHQVLLLLETLLEYDSYRLSQALLGSPIAISHLVSILSERREVLRDVALLILAKLTTNQLHDLQKIIAFQGAFDKAFSIIDAEGGLTGICYFSFSHGLGSKIVDDSLLLIGNLLIKNSTNQRYFRELHGVQKLVLLFRAALSGADWRSDKKDILNYLHKGTNDVALQMGKFLLSHVICHGLLSPLKTPSVIQSQTALGLECQIPFFALLFDALQASISLPWISTVESIRLSQPLSYSQPELIIGVLGTFGHLIQGHTENRSLFSTFFHNELPWHIHIAMISMSSISTLCSNESLELALRDAALFVLSSLDNFSTSTSQESNPNILIVPPTCSDPASIDQSISHTVKQAQGHGMQEIEKFNDGSLSPMHCKQISDANISILSSVKVAIQILFDSEWDSCSIWPINYAARVLICYLKGFQNEFIRKFILTLVINNQGLLYTEPPRDTNENFVTIVDLIMRFLRPNNISVFSLKNISLLPSNSRISRFEKASAITCKSLFSLLVHLSNGGGMNAFLNLFISEISTMNIYILIEWISPNLESTLLSNLAAYLFTRLVWSARVSDATVQNKCDSSGNPRSFSSFLMELLDVRVGLDAIASRLHSLQQSFFVDSEVFNPFYIFNSEIVENSKLASIGPLDWDTIEIIRVDLNELQEFVRMPISKQIDNDHSCNNPYSLLPLNIREILISKDQSTLALISAKDDLLVERDSRILELSNKIMEQASIIEKQLMQFDEFSKRLQAIDQYQSTISHLEGKLESLTTAYNSLKLEHNQLLVMLADFTSPNPKSANLPIFEKPGLISPAKNLNTFPSFPNGSTMSTPKGNPLSSVLPFLWKVVPTAIQSHLTLNNSSPQEQNAPPSSNNLSHVNCATESYSNRPMHQTESSQVPASEVKLLNDTNCNQDSGSYVTPAHINDYNSIGNAHIDPLSCSETYTTIYDDPNSNGICNDEPQLVLNPSTGDAGNNLAYDYSGPRSSFDSYTSKVPNVKQVHSYYMNMNYNQISFEDSLGFVPQPEIDY